MASYVKAIADSMRLPTKASTDEVLQLIEGKLSEEGREPRDVKVIVQRPTDEGAEDGEHVCLFVVDDGGVITRARVAVESEQPARVRVESTHTDVEAEDAEDETYLQLQQKELELNATLEELDEVRKKNAEAEAALIDKDVQIEHLTNQLRREKERFRQVWRMNCEQLNEHDAVLASKEEEIVQLQERICMQSRAVVPGEGVPLSSSTEGSRSAVI